MNQSTLSNPVARTSVKRDGELNLNTGSVPDGPRWTGILPAADDRAAWSQIAHRLGPDHVAALLAEAQSFCARPIPNLPATLYLQVVRTGERGEYDAALHGRRCMLDVLTAAECLENQGRFLDRILDLIWAICEESSWVMPTSVLDLPDVENPRVDLMVAMTALALASADAVLEHRLDGTLRRRIRFEVERRAWLPYLSGDYWWLTPQPGRRINNWTAVCSGGVTVSALLLDGSSERVERILHRAVPSLRHYLESFDSEGGCEEGLSYWAYGFGYFVVAAEQVRNYTAGRTDLLAEPGVQQIAQFPLRMALSGNGRCWVTFSDCIQQPRLGPGMLARLGDRLDVPALTCLARSTPWDRLWLAKEGFLLHDLAWWPEAGDSNWLPAQHDWFGGLAWMIARTDPAGDDALALAIKGGHNGESHNHNDLGSFIVSVGGEQLLTDLGAPFYERDYFSPKRVQFFVASSEGHSVPAPNGYLQLRGEQYKASVIRHEHNEIADRIELDLTHAYPPAAGLVSLRRRAVLDRTRPRGLIEVVDEYEFHQPGIFSTALITTHEPQIHQGCIRIHRPQRTLQVCYDHQLLNICVQPRMGVRLSEQTVTVYRIVLSTVQPARTGSVRLVVE